jgi:hypothetical protein
MESVVRARKSVPPAARLAPMATVISSEPVLWIFGVLLAAVLLKAAARKRRETLPAYKAKGPLCSPTESAFLAALEQALPPTQRVFVQVRLIDVIEPRRADPAARNRVISKQLDFVVCDHTTLKVLFAIELNDRSHERPERQQRDAFLSNAMRDAGLPLYFFKAARRYTPQAVQEQLFQQGLKQEPRVDWDAMAVTGQRTSGG